VPGATLAAVYSVALRFPPTSSRDRSIGSKSRSRLLRSNKKDISCADGLEARDLRGRGTVDSLAAETAQDAAESHNQHAEQQHEPRRSPVAKENAGRDKKRHER
jgi:hypothetical protein